MTSELEQAESVVRETGVSMATDDDGVVLPLLLIAFEFGDHGVLTYFTTMAHDTAIAFARTTAQRLDSGTGTTAPELAAAMRELGKTIGPRLPRGWGFAFAAGAPDDLDDDTLHPFAYIANAQRQDIAESLREFAAILEASHRHDGIHPAGHG